MEAVPHRQSAGRHGSRNVVVRVRRSADVIDTCPHEDASALILTTLFTAIFPVFKCRAPQLCMDSNKYIENCGIIVEVCNGGTRVCPIGEVWGELEPSSKALAKLGPLSRRIIGYTELVVWKRAVSQPSTIREVGPSLPPSDVQ